MLLRAPISFFLLFGTNSSPEKVQHFLVSPNSIKVAPNGLFFGAPTGSEVPSTIMSIRWKFHFVESVLFCR